MYEHASLSDLSMPSNRWLFVAGRRQLPLVGRVLERHIQPFYIVLVAQVAVVSRGAAGSVARARSGARGASGAARVAVADTVGAGDGHTAGFLHAYLAGASLDVRAAHLFQALTCCCSDSACVGLRDAAHGHAADAILCIRSAVFI